MVAVRLSQYSRLTDVVLNLHSIYVLHFGTWLSIIIYGLGIDHCEFIRLHE